MSQSERLLNVAEASKRLGVSILTLRRWFMFNVFQEFFESQGVTIEWTEEVFPQSYEAELVTDMLTLLSSFSAKIYGKRSAARKKAKRKGS